MIDSKQVPRFDLITGEILINYQVRILKITYIFIANYGMSSVSKMRKMAKALMITKLGKTTSRSHLI